MNRVSERDDGETAPALRSALTVIVPCYNAGPRVAPVVSALREIVDHVIAVDDGSTDGAVQALAELGARVITLPENQGKGFALLAGFRAALERPNAVGVAVLDADGQHDPNELPRLHREFVQRDADLVIGSRTFDFAYVPFVSRIGNKVTAAVTRMALHRELPDTQSGFRIHSRKLTEYVLENVGGGRYETEMTILVEAVRRGFTVVPVPIKTIYESGNPSSHFNRFRDSLRISATLLHLCLRK